MEVRLYWRAIGSILGLPLFLPYIKDIVTEIGSNIRLFADDTSLFIIVENPDTAEVFNDDLHKISFWAINWLVKFNLSKNEILVVTRKTNKPVHPPVFMLNERIKVV